MNLLPRHSLFDFDNLFDRFWPGHVPAVEDTGTTFTPRVDIHDKGDHYEISAELPGVAKEDVHVSIDNGVLSIEAETRQEHKEEKDGKVIRQERRYGKFMRSFSLGADIAEKDINASFSNGVLTLTAPKPSVATTAKKRIEIK